MHWVVLRITGSILSMYLHVPNFQCPSKHFSRRFASSQLSRALFNCTACIFEKKFSFLETKIGCFAHELHCRTFAPKPLSRAYGAYFRQPQEAGAATE